MSGENAFETLVRLSERSQAVYQELPAKANAQTHWTGIGFSLLGQGFVVSMDEVAELMRVPQATRVPGVKNFVLGIANVRGRLMIIVDLALFFGERSRLPRTQRRILAFEEGELYLGFVVDESLGMQHFPSDTYSREASELPDIFKSYTAGSYKTGGANWPIIRLSALASDPELEKVNTTD